VKPSFAAPTTFQKATLIKGRGELVKAGDSVTVQYKGWVWSNQLDSPFGVPFDSSWDAGRTPAAFNLTTGDGGVISGFVKAIAGETVGSQVIASLPPADGYGAGGKDPSIPGNATLLFVIDILGINK